MKEMVWRVLMGVVAFLFFAFGILIIFLSSNKHLVSNLSWDPSMCGLGVALVGLAYIFMEWVRRNRNR